MYLKFAPLKTNKTGISGTLFITNFKVSFVTSLPVDSKESELHDRSLQNHFLGVHDVCLSEVDSVNQFFEGSTKKKRLYHNAPLPSRLSGLQLVLKNLRIINFSFKFTPAGEDLRVAQALLHHAFPPTIDHLFLSCGHPPPPPGIPDFCMAQDWEREIQRTRCPNWRVSKHNEFFNLCSSLPAVVVVPRDLLDAQLEQAAQHFQGTRPPVWCWGSLAGAALVRMAQISPSITDKQQENRMMGLVHRCHPKKLQPFIMDLDQILPSLKDIQISYMKLRELHTPDDPTQFWEQDRHYYSRWESSRWLSHVSKCLEGAKKAANAMLHHNSSVILQESEGRDLSAVISSLVQLILDPQVRTIRGFHCLIQKEWVALGHPFSTRLGHTRNQVEEQSPVWLLFLDCVYQVSVQHYAALEFTSEYLVALWHSAHCSLHSSFMFNSINAKYTAANVLQRENPHQPIYLRPVWSWWGENRSLLRNQQNGATEDYSEKRSSSREAFLNVHYIQNLLDSLSASGALMRISDPLSSAYHTWHRIKYLLEDTGSLPFDPSLSLVPLQLDTSLRIDVSLSSLKPWKDCFCAWVSEPATLTLNESESLLKCTTTNPQHWKHIYQIYHTLKNHLSESLTNGTVN
ncbi:myotubularin-related protein 10-B-like isoform X2 [Homarus americanus]|uniref:myotubularin-related protein 10-B-like isoform X2 n=1 Tax=Homarus americanus TaxID=6706 RepID=UPI001C47C4A4|nr:myotubularin-related protein 10-B-like isoform X2 [Homarus americanus]